MDFLSDTAKKEKRNLLAAGFVGILVARLKIFPTEIDVLGLKFQSPDLPLIVIQGLCVAIGYFLVKFLISFAHEWTTFKKDSLVLQIREGKTALDTSREEESLNDLARHVIDQRKVLQGQQANAETRINNLQLKIDQDDLAHETSLILTDQKIIDWDMALAKDPGQHIRTSDGVLRDRGDIEKYLKTLKESRTSILRQKETQHQQNVENLEYEKNNWKTLYDTQVKDIGTSESVIEEKRKALIQWKRLHSTVGIVSPIHLFLEIALPIFVGLIAIGYLIYLMSDFPAPPKPPSLPKP